MSAKDVTRAHHQLNVLLVDFMHVMRKGVVHLWDGNKAYMLVIH
jgi:hypothetical protein